MLSFLRITIIAALMIAPTSAFAKTAPEPVADTFTTVGAIAPEDNEVVKPGEIGKSTSEILSGNGSRAGYFLGHSNIVPDSETVYVGLRRLNRNKDYTIDYTNGTLFFAEPVRTVDTVKVDYRYSEGAKGERNLTGPSSMPLSFGENAKLNFTYAYRTAKPEEGPSASDVLTYGFKSDLNIGSGSKLSSMFYVASPQASNRMSLSALPQPSKKGEKVVKDSLMLQNADLSLGKVRLQLGYQDVGEDFAGFNSLRETNAVESGLLNQLQKEAGIQRMNMSAELPTGENTGLKFGFDQIEDQADDISTMFFGYKTDMFMFDYSSRHVGADFTRFKDLKEADRMQMANEAGIERTHYAMQFRTGVTGDNTPIWSGIKSTELKSETGSMSMTSANVQMGKVTVEADVRDADPGFTRMAALNDEERTRMALMARKQFDPNAQASQVTNADKAKLNAEAGLSRQNYLVLLDGAVKTWLTLSSVDGQKGSLERTSVNFQGRNFEAHLDHHSIDATFDRLTHLQPIELQNYGNEYGMSRTDFGANFTLGATKAGLTHSSVTDHQGAEMLRRSISFEHPRLKLKANFQDIDAEFSRIMDLSDADKQSLVRERGFSRADYSINFQATKALNIDSYIYDSDSLVAGQTRDQERHTIKYTPNNGLSITAFADDYSYISEAGNLSSYERTKLFFDKNINLLGGLRLQATNDVNTVQDGAAGPITTVIEQTHLETNQNAKISFTHDVTDIDYGEGKTERSQTLGMKTKLTDTFAFTGSYGTTKTESDSETNSSIGVDWQVRDNLKLSLNLIDEDTARGRQNSERFSMEGLLAKRFLFLSNVQVSSGVNQNNLAGRQVLNDNSLKLEADLLGGHFVLDNADKLNPHNGIYYTSRVLQYEIAKSEDRPYYLSLFQQELVMPNGQPATKYKYVFNWSISPKSALSLDSYFGKDARNGLVVPVGSTAIKYTHSLNDQLKFFADYTREVNDVQNLSGHIVGLGIQGNLSNGAAVELYYGIGKVFDNGITDDENIFRLRYDHKMSSEHFITLTAEKKSGVHKHSINPFEGDTVARIDFRTTFD